MWREVDILRVNPWQKSGGFHAHQSLETEFALPSTAPRGFAGRVAAAAGAMAFSLPAEAFTCGNSFTGAGPIPGGAGARSDSGFPTATACGSDAAANGAGATATGANATATGTYATTSGFDSSASGAQATATGDASSATGDFAGAFGVSLERHRP